MLREDPGDSGGERRPIVVQKYGGSSVADIDKLGRVADRVVATRAAGCDVVVVVSAMGKTTDGLLELAAQAAQKGQGTAPRRELDMLVSTGERVAMALLSIAIQTRGHDAISFTGSQCGIITNDRHFDARIIEVRPHRIEDEIARGKIVIVAGFQGMSYRREITTLGRGGSDTTAVALAAALGAERCEIYSDVDGVYSADPRVVREARHLPEVDYATLQELATSGAKVLCAQAVEWARKAGVAIHARSTFDDSAKPRETIVRPNAGGNARAVSCDRKIALCRMRSPDDLPAMLAFLDEAALTVLELGGDNIILSLLNAPDWQASRQALQRMTAVQEDVALVSVVGGQLTDRAESIARFRATVAAREEPLLVMASPLRFSAVVAAGDADDIVRDLHTTFVG